MTNLNSDVVARMLCISTLLLTAPTLFDAVLSDGDGGVTYDGRSLIINGEHKLLFSGSIHYPRSTPDMWPSLIAKAKEGGIDVIQTYVFWNIHERKRGKFNFSGRRDIVRFIKEIHAQGLYACLRIGPFIEAEWGYGGLPFWLHDVPDIVYRSNNEPFKLHMQNFTTKIVNMMKSEGLYASQGGPIILSQIENEYTLVEAAFHEQGPPYVLWAANMAVSLQTGVPWSMCKQDDAPDPLINTCNGMRCGETFAGPNSPNKPSIWTENWTSFYQTYGDEPLIRSAEEMAFHVALFIAAKNGTYVNYYMYHGGTNFGRTASSFVIASYYDQAPLDEYGLIREPKWSHLRELHAAIKLCSKPLLSGRKSNFSLGQFQEAYVFKADTGECAAFLVNRGAKDANILFQNITYELPQSSISILPDCRTVAFNTRTVSAQHNTRSMTAIQKFSSSEEWQEFKETIPTFDETTLRAHELLEHMGTTEDNSDYLWYTSSVQLDSTDSQQTLEVDSLAHVVHAFVNGVYAGSAHGSFKNRNFSLDTDITLRNGVNNISILSVMVGLPDSGAHLERRVAGLRRVSIQGKNLSAQPWGYKVGLSGEQSRVFLKSSDIQWSRLGNSSQPLIWYKTQFDAPPGDDPIALNLGSMGKGAVWVNGHGIGRYWVSFLTSKGEPSQKWYNVPRSFLKPTQNLLIILEEESGNPIAISLDAVSISKTCGQVSESHYPQLSQLMNEEKQIENKRKHHSRKPAVQLRCPHNKKISKILFASFGTPTGDCQSQNYATGICHSPNSTTIVENACLGKTKCSIPVSNLKFGGDPCRYVIKSLLVDAQCS